MGDKLRVSEMVGQFVEKRPHTCSDQVRCTCGRLAGELPGKCREWSGDGRAEGGRLGLMYIPPALSGGLSSPTQTPQYPTSPKFPNMLRPFCKAPEAEFVLGCRLPPPPPPPRPPPAIRRHLRLRLSRLQPAVACRSTCRCSPPSLVHTLVSPSVQIFRARSQTRLQVLEDHLSGPRSAGRPE